jgi:DNA polymerase-3 subunit gamma/tau
MSSQYIALYRKYRPQEFSDVVGQEHVVTLLQSTISQKKVSHAYLFCGGRGTGKTTVARIFARDIGCNPEDIIEIDAASNRGIDEIRELREAVRTAPFSSPYKVYIIDEAHMLTKEAANALLKTLEEPPSHVIFILATTDPDKLPATIVSRCQKLVFIQPDIETLSKRLLYVAEGEGKDMSEETARLVATHGKGSYRDALSVLEQVFATNVKKIAHETVLAFLGVADKEDLLSLLESLCEKDAEKLLTVFSRLEVSHSTVIKAYDDITEMVRVGLLLRVGEKNIGDGLPKEHIDRLTILSKEHPYFFSSKTILELLSSRHLILVSESSALPAFQAIMIGFLEEERKGI